MKYKIVGYNKQEDYFWCEDSNKKKWRIDLFTDNSHDGFFLKDNWREHASDLFGKEISVGMSFPYILIAQNVKLL